jgi:hypothetical protein
MKTKKYTQINSKAFFDFKIAASNLRITKLSPDDIAKMKQQLDQILN